MAASVSVTTACRDRHAQQTQQRAELRQVLVRFLTRLAAMRRLQNERSVLREAGASGAVQAAAKLAALEARTAVGEALTELQLLAADPRVLELAPASSTRRCRLHFMLQTGRLHAARGLLSLHFDAALSSDAGVSYRGPWRLPGPDLQWLAILSLASGYIVHIPSGLR
ncbi:hypothetical protein OG762_46875 (plasmid) [Streptomyces sp. NBC_01136]|uniref:hypothetical protein n=1 Tax=unclassified Streptomyces TaxID=2593676 RepID=UPI0032541B3A|nr:hypothetical protein OG762_46875 [Streptomyces sp. NBC_01136]